MDDRQGGRRGAADRGAGEVERLAFRALQHERCKRPGPFRRQRSRTAGTRRAARRARCYALARGFTAGLPSRSGSPFSNCHDLLEALAEIELEVVPLGPAEMRRAQHVVHLQERVVAAGDRLLLVDVHRGVAGPALLQRVEQRAGRHQLGARHVDEQRGRLHPRQVVGADDAARLGAQPHADRQHIGALEQVGLALGRLVARGRGLRQRVLLAPDQHLHAEPLAALGDQRADVAEPEDAERRAANAVRQRARPFAVPHPLGLERDVPARGDDQRQGQLGRRHRRVADAGRDRDAQLGGGVEIEHVRAPPDQRDQLELGQPLQQRAGKFHALADRHHHVGVLEALDELVEIARRLTIARHVVMADQREARQADRPCPDSRRG